MSSSVHSASNRIAYRMENKRKMSKSKTNKMRMRWMRKRDSAISACVFLYNAKSVHYYLIGITSQIRIAKTLRKVQARKPECLLECRFKRRHQSRV